MAHLGTWIQACRWRALTGSAACLVGYLLIADGWPRAAWTYTSFGTWRQQRAKIASVAEWEVRGAQLDGRKRLLQRRFADLYVNVSSSDQISVLLQVLQESAAAIKIELREIRPAERMALPGYEALPFQVVLHGRFHKIGRFIDYLEQSPYVVKVQQIHLQRASPSSEELRAEVSFSVIVLKAWEGAP